MGIDLNPANWSVGGQSAGELLFGSKGEANTSEHSLLTPEQQAKLKELLAQLQVGGSGGDAYTGQLTADPNKVQGASLAALEQAAMNQVTPGGENDISSKALTEIINAGPADIQASVVDPTMQDFVQKILPAISGRFSGMSGFGSDRMMQEGIAAGNATTTIAQARAEALDTQQGRKMTAAGLLPQVQSGWLNNILGIQAGGETAQKAAQAPLESAYNEFLRKQQLKQGNIDNILAALGLKGKENITTVTPGTTGLLQGFANGVGAGVGEIFGASLKGG